MAIDYTRLFGDIGSFITAIDRIRDITTGDNSPRPDLVALEQMAQDDLSATTGSTPRGRFEVLSGLDNTYESIKDQAVTWCDLLAAYVTTRLLDEDTVIAELPGMGDGATIDRVLSELFNDMLNQNQTVLESTVTLGSLTGTHLLYPEGTRYLTADAINRGDGMVFVTKRIDGVNAPGANLDAHPLYARPRTDDTQRNSEMVVESEELLWTCSGDQYDSGYAEGSETFTLESRPNLGGTFTWRTEGTGESLTITNANGVNQQLSNQDFEDWTDAATPVGWTIALGTVAQEQAAANVFRGSTSLSFTGSGEITQDVSAVLQPRTMYVATIAVKAATAANLTFQIVGTLADGSTYIAGQVGAPSYSHAEEIVTEAIATNWVQRAIFYLTPDQPMADAVLSVKTDAALYVDSVTFGAVQWIGGVGTCVVAGANPWVTGDRIRVAISNDDAGRFQRFWRKYYNRQLPSATSGSPTITEPVL